jgi:hypothetical protein
MNAVTFTENLLKVQTEEFKQVKKIYKFIQRHEKPFKESLNF